MSDHNSAVFNNSCLKVPRNPRSSHPFPIYEQKYYSRTENNAQKNRCGLLKSDMEVKPKREKTTLKSFMEFYDSIPEYDDVNHLSNKEFYRRLENLKEKQRSYYEHLQNSYKNKSTEWIDDYKKLNLDDKPETAKTNKPFCATPVFNKNKRLDDVESITSSDDKEIELKPPSRRSVRIESPTPEPFSRPKSRANFSPATNFDNDSIWDDLSTDDFKLELDKSPVETKSLPNSPTRNAKPSVGFVADGITIPKPFQMTVRDEENRIIDEVISTGIKPKEKPDLFRAHPVPIESQIPLFDKIMAEQELRSQKVRKKRKAQLSAQMKPFSFTKREEELQALSRRLWKSSPSVFLDEAPIKVKQFKAKPIPKNLFSNYIYKKMHEDEFYRSLQKKIRAEELLKASSLPPSMAKREKTRPKYDVCPRSFRDLDSPEDSEKSEKKTKRKPNYKREHDRINQELEALKNEFISTSPRPYKFKASKLRRCKSASRNSAASRSSDNRSQSSLGLSSINRSNLAAVLRIQSAKKRLEMEMCRKLEEVRLKEETRWREKVLRRRPVWQTLAYSNEEDLAMRLQMRRDEQKLRTEEHRYRMQKMLGRVNQQPTLFERQSVFASPKTREKLLRQIYKDLKYSESPDPCSSDSSAKRSITEMKDEAIQAYLDEELAKSEGNESDHQEIKEECDCNSDDEEEKKSK